MITRIEAMPGRPAPAELADCAEVLAPARVHLSSGNDCICTPGRTPIDGGTRDYIQVAFEWKRRPSAADLADLRHLFNDTLRLPVEVPMPHEPS